jgi:type IV secretion system protein VirD4
VSRPPQGSHHPGPGDGVLLVVGAAGLVTWVWVWATGQIAGRVAGGRWPRVHFGEVGSILAALPHHMGDPRLAWPAATRAGLPGPVLMYGWAAAVLVPLVGVALVCWRGPRRRGHRGRGSDRGVRHPYPGRSAGARWGTRVDTRSIRSRRRGANGRLVLGRAHASWAGSRLLATETRHSVLVIGPTQSGKTSGLAIPALLEWAGPVIATSVKDDLAATTLAWRSRSGSCQIFDPTRTSGLEPLARWTPLGACDGWSDAQRVASWLVDATPARTGMADAAFWYAAAAKQLAPLLLAAKSAGMSMAEVVAWTNSGDFDEALGFLELAGETEAALALAACAGRDERIRSSVSTTLETVLAPFEDPVVAASTAACDVDLAAMLDTGGSLYLCGPSHEQNRVQGLFASMVSAAIAQAVRRVNAGGRPLDPPLLLVLDEAANIAPVPDLDTLASTGAGLGIQLVTVCQDLSQLSARYGSERTRTIANNHRAKVLLSGVSDMSTLDMISGLAGEQAVSEETVTHDLRDGRRTSSRATVFRRLAPTDELRRIPPGEGVLVYGHLPPVRLRLRPWYRDRRLRRRVDQDRMGWRLPKRG